MMIWRTTATIVRTSNLLLLLRNRFLRRVKMMTMRKSSNRRLGNMLKVSPPRTPPSPPAKGTTGPATSHPLRQRCKNSAICRWISSFMRGNEQCARCQHTDYPCVTIPRGLTGKKKAIRCLGCTTRECSFSDPRPQSDSFPITCANFSTLVGIAEDLVSEKHPLGAVQRRVLLKMSKEMGIPME